MELSDIEKLLEKYFEGETTISEEKEIKVSLPLGSSL